MTARKNDPFGKALKDFLETGKTSDIIVHSDISEEDVIPVKYLFRTFDQMPEIERKALQTCKGKVLDVGAGGGPHALWLQENGISVTAIDTSQGAAEVMKQRGISSVKNSDIYDLAHEKYDTILLLMNGIGIAGKLDHLPKFLSHLKSLLNENGQILIESTDIAYVFTEDDGSMWINATKKYYGEVSYQMEYNGIKGGKFDWLFIDFEKLSACADKAGLKPELIHKEEAFNFLAKLSFVTR